MMLLIVPLPLRVEHLQRDQAGIGRGAGLLAVRVVAVAGDDAGDVRAVAVVVVRRGPAVDEVDEHRDALVAVGIQLAVELFVRSSCQLVMPESITATPTPAPVRPSVSRTALVPTVSDVR